MRVVITREKQDAVQTLGKLRVYDVCDELVLELFTLELPWNENRKGISCIPKGEYLLKQRTSAKYSNHLIVLNAETKDHPYPRTFILIHPANYVKQLRGCIAVGKTIADINRDGTPDITSSKKAMEELMKVITDEYTTLTIQ